MEGIKGSNGIGGLEAEEPHLILGLLEEVTSSLNPEEKEPALGGCERRGRQSQGQQLQRP